MNTQMSGIDATEAMRQTERIVASQVFEKAKRSQRLLRYLVDAALADPPRAVKEYTIATEVFDRDAGYDPAIDATVRVEAGRLRTRLREYYGEEGREDRLLVEVPKGAYRVLLSDRDRSSKSVVAPQRQHSSDSSSRLAYEPSRLATELHEPVRAAGEEVYAASPSSLEERQAPPAQPWISALRIGRYALATLAVGLVLGYVTWRLARAKPSDARPRSVAVLPLKNLSGDPAQDYFADGTTDELITQLARVPGLRVVSWNSVVQEKNTSKSLQTIAQELRADLLVEGSVARVGGTVRINAQLIDTRSDTHLWADSFEGPLTDAMALESKAAAEIVAHASADRTTRQLNASVIAQPSVNPAAHDAYLRGRNYFDKRQGRESVEQFQRAIDLSPNYASAYSGLATAFQAEAVLGQARPEEVVPKAMAAVETALKLDPDNGDALIARGGIETTFLWRWEAAERDLTRGIALSPNNSYGRMMLSVYLDSIGRTDDAVRQMQQAVEIDPLSFFMARQLGSALFYARRYDEALRQLQYAREMHPASAIVVDHWIGQVYEKKGMYDDAVRYDLLEQQDHHLDQDARKLLAVYHQDGFKAYWAARLQGLKVDRADPCYGYHYGRAAMRAGRNDEALAELKQAVDQHCYWLGVARVDPSLDDLRSDPKFADLLTDLHLPPVARQ